MGQQQDLARGAHHPGQKLVAPEERSGRVARPALTAKELARLRHDLLAKGRALAEDLAALMAGLTPKGTDLLFARPGETPVERTRRYLDVVDRKIKAIATGGYGRCERCATAISYVELAELPWMDVCRACAEAA